MSPPEEVSSYDKAVMLDPLHHLLEASVGHVLIESVASAFGWDSGPCHLNLETQLNTDAVLVSNLFPMLARGVTKKNPALQPCLQVKCCLCTSPEKEELSSPLSTSFCHAFEDGKRL